MSDTKDDGAPFQVGESRDQRIRRGLRRQIFDQLDLGCERQFGFRDLGRLTRSLERTGPQDIGPDLQRPQASNGRLCAICAFFGQGTAPVVAVPVFLVHGNPVSEKNDFNHFCGVLSSCGGGVILARLSFLG